MSDKTITHPGFIRKLMDDMAEVVIISKSGCASCEINGSCSVSDMEEKIIDIKLKPQDNYKIGDEVVVEMKQSQGTWAVLLAYIFPFLVILISLIVLTSADVDQGLSGLISLGLLIPYYTILYFLKTYIKSRFEYFIKA
ncbi:MAG: RseC/MucC family positive regulator of sigma(E) [Marinilabiliales bacterium]|nr:MAG: RseC/MucC family positive regulator of sigma(E) [Marinilabiliales bacterium]